ncbi:CDGSH iron-sulfur domain-containing protein [Nonomuraea sp. NPDC001699]
MADEVTITLTEDGPYLVTGPVKLTDADGREIAHPDEMSLCRCGQSGNKPFCDGTHLTIDFDGTPAN